MAERCQTRSTRSLSSLDIGDIAATDETIQDLIAGIGALKDAKSLDGTADPNDNPMSGPPTPKIPAESAENESASPNMKTTMRKPDEQRVKGLDIDKGIVDERGHAQPSLPGKRPTTLTPEQICLLAEKGDKKDLSDHPGVFYTRGRFAHEIKPEYVWVLLQRKGNRLALSEERLKVVFPEYKFVLEAPKDKGKKRKLKAEADGQPEASSAKKKRLISPPKSCPASGNEEDGFKELIAQQKACLDNFGSLFLHLESRLLNIGHSQHRLDDSMEELKAGVQAFREEVKTEIHAIINSQHQVDKPQEENRVASELPTMHEGAEPKAESEERLKERLLVDTTFEVASASASAMNEPTGENVFPILPMDLNMTLDGEFEENPQTAE